MLDFVSVLGVVFGFLGSGSAVLTWVVYRKQSLRIKNAEAYEKEVDVLRKEIAELRNAIEFERKQREADREVIVRLELLNSELRDKNDVAEIKNARNKKALNKAYECEFCPDSSKCPALVQRKRNEDEYLRELQEKSGYVHGNGSKDNK